METKELYKEITDKQYLFTIYSDLCDENNSKLWPWSYMTKITHEWCFDMVDEDFLKMLIFGERKQQIIKRHVKQIEQELKEIYPNDSELCKSIKSHCGNTRIDLNFYDNDFKIDFVNYK